MLCCVCGQVEFVFLAYTSVLEPTDENKDTPHYKLMVLLEQELPECSRREQIDEIDVSAIPGFAS